MTDLWVEKFRPTALDDYVWTSSELRQKVDEWLADGALPHLLFAGGAGTGKTSLAYLLLRLLDIPKGDILYINASKERKVEDIQSRIGSFVQTYALGPTEIKYVILDESDKISPTAQGFLRAEMEQYHKVCRFILTANYVKALIPAIRSRVQEFTFTNLNREDFLVRIATVLVTEGVTFDDDVLVAYMNRAYPDLRKTINLLQQRSVRGDAGLVLLPPVSEDEGTKDWMLDMSELFKQGRFRDARTLVLSQAQPEEYEDIYRWLYRNLQVFGEDEDQQDKALMAIRQGLVNHALVADAEINLAATMAHLATIARGGE